MDNGHTWRTIVHFQLHLFRRGFTKDGITAGWRLRAQRWRHRLGQGIRNCGEGQPLDCCCEMLRIVGNGWELLGHTMTILFVEIHCNYTLFSALTCLEKAFSTVHWHSDASNSPKVKLWNCLVEIESPHWFLHMTAMCRRNKLHVGGRMPHAHNVKHIHTYTYINIHHTSGKW